MSLISRFNLQLVLSYLFVVAFQYSLAELPRCGETFNTESGGIFHKPFEPVMDNERCVWIIATLGASGYKINVQFLGRPTNEPRKGQELSITGVRHGDTDAPTLTSYLPVKTGTFTVDECNIAIVTFFSEKGRLVNSHGFALEFEAVNDKNITKISASSTNTLLEGTHFDFKYPLGVPYYTAMELSIIVSFPVNNIHEMKRKRMWYKKSVFQGNTCNDSVFVYTFSVSRTTRSGNWEPAGRLCGNTDSYLISHEDLVLVIFQSDIASQHTGFWLSFVFC